jgi:hypothetical protein
MSHPSKYLAKLSSRYAAATEMYYIITISFSSGRIFGYAENRALRGFRPDTGPMAPCRDRFAPLQYLARQHPFGVSVFIRSADYADCADYGCA